MKLCYRCLLLVVLFSTFVSASAWAAGLWLYEAATPDVGTAAAGRAAAANDASIAIPQFTAYRQKSYNSAAQSDLRNVKTNLEAYYADYQHYP